MTVHHLGVREVVSLAIIYLSAKTFLSLPQQMAYASTAAWMLPLIAGIYGPIQWLAMLAVVKHAPGGSVVEGTEAILGPWLGTLVNLSYAAYLIVLTAIVVRQFALDIRAIFLPQTPTGVIIITIMLVGAYLTYLGIESLARTAALVGPILLVGFLLLIVGGLYTHAELNALHPVWGPGVPKVFYRGLALTGLYAEAGLLGLVAPTVRSERQYRTAGWLALGSAVVLITGAMVAVEYLFPYPALAHTSFPMLQMSQLLSLGPGAQRMESVFFFIWLSTLLIKVSAGFFCAVNGAARALRIPHYRYLIFPMCWLAYALANLPLSADEVVRLDMVGLRIYGGLLAVGVPVVTALIGLVRKGRSQSDG